jgi:hypothetical protein
MNLANCEYDTVCHLTLASPCIIMQLKYINELDATVPQVYYLMFMCGSIYFGRLNAHHQDLTTILASSGLTVGASWLAVLLVVV